MDIKAYMAGFMDFIRKQGVVGVAVGFVLAGAVAKMVTALVTDIINPLIGLVLVNAANLKNAKFTIRNVEILWGDFVSTTIDFLIIALIVYFVIKLLGIDTAKKK
ncbi:MAG: MscL family protein [Candidatus Moraniibacteriota bacterium]